MPARGTSGRGSKVKASSRLRSAASKSGKVKKIVRSPRKKDLLGEKDLALHYHILKLLVGSIFRTPDDQIHIDDVLKRTKKWLIVTPFTRPRLQKGLTSLAARKLLLPVEENGKKSYRITDRGRLAYKQYREVMTLWRIEKVAGERLQLYSVSEVFKKRSARERDYIPDECFIDWPLKFLPVFHRFSGRKELRIYDAFEKFKK